MVKQTCIMQCFLITLILGNDYGCTWPDAIQIKGSVCHSNNMDLVA